MYNFAINEIVTFIVIKYENRIGKVFVRRMV